LDFCPSAVISEDTLLLLGLWFDCCSCVACGLMLDMHDF